MIKHARLIAIVSIGAASIILWSFFVVPELTTSSDVLEITAQNVGMIQFADNVGDELSEPIKMIFDWKRKVIDVSGSEVKIRTTYDYKDIVTDESFWVIELDEIVNRFSREYIDKPGYIMFPINVEKRDYDVYDVGGVVLHYTYEGTEEFDGLQVYKFSGQATFDISEVYPDFAEPIFEEYSATNHIDPVTGLEISFLEEFTDYAIINDEKIVVLDASSETTEFSQAVLITQAKQLQTLFFVYNIVIPFIFGIVTIGVFIGTLLHTKLKLEHAKLLSAQETIEEQQHKALKAEKLSGIGELASRLAHDLRNPLTVIKTNMDLMQRTDDISEKEKTRIEAMNESIDRMSHQIDNVLDFVRVKDQSFAPHNIKQILHTSQRDFQIPKNIQISISGDDLTINCDFENMRIAFNNLIFNAIQAIGSKEGTISIIINEDDQNYIISVQDSGSGISDEVLPKLFEPLFTTKQEGTGLGLASVKAIIEKHNGTITVSRNPTTFIITLPKKID